MATSPYAASVEEVEDEEDMAARAKPKLDRDTDRYLVMSESAYREHSEKGGNVPQNERKSAKRVDSQEKKTKKEGRTKKMFDKPALSPKPEWIRDPRLPNELNEMTSAMWTHKTERNYGMHASQYEAYREASPDEESGPYEFSAYLREEIRRRPRTDTKKIRLPTVDESLFAIRALAERYDTTKKPSIPTLGKDNEKPRKQTEERIANLRQGWYDRYQDLLHGTKEELPPLREVNHEINLIDLDAKYTYHLPRCPTAFRDQFYTKLNRYVAAKWWEPKTTAQAAPLLCVAKKDGKLRTVVDARQRNDNTVKDVTPLPDQEIIREDVARASIRSKMDLSDAYEQVRVRPEDVWKTSFATIAGTYVSNVVQQGDCNAPATFQRLMTAIFRDVIGKFVHVYLDDIFIFSDSVEDHEDHLKVVFERLKNSELFLKWSKCNLYAKELECLGHIIDDRGIHPDTDKLQRIRDWRTPRNYNDIQRFVGLVNYVSNFLPDITTYTAPLQCMVKNGAPFFWRPIHQRCFDMIKRICCKTPIIRPITYQTDEPVWLICDASKTGVGAMYGQGKTWQTCRPAGFMSKKFSYAQQHYAVHELETLAILEALHKWEDKLIGQKIHVITDHKALEFFKTQSTLSNRQRRWIEYMSKFNFDITYIKGEYNKVADCLSRYYENDTVNDIHEFHEYVHADRLIDPDGEDLPMERVQEIKERRVEINAMRALETRHAGKLREAYDHRKEEADLLMEADKAQNKRAKSKNVVDPTSEKKLEDIIGLPPNKSTVPLLGNSPDADERIIREIKRSYEQDPLTKMVLTNPENHKQSFQLKDGLLWTKNIKGEYTICVPRDKKLLTKILTQAHEIVGHYGDQRTCEYVRRWYWWPQMSKMTYTFCKTCEPCQKSKPSNQKPAGKLHQLPIPTKPWDSVGMDFVGPFPEVNGFNYLWVVICRLTSMVHLIPTTTQVTATELSWKYLREVVRLHGLPGSIVSDRDTKFTSRWWQELHRILGAKLLMSTSYHPQTDGQSERAIRNVTQILRSVVKPDQKDWITKVDMVEFAINSSVSDTTGYAPFELNGGYMPSMIKEIRNDETFAQGVKAFALTALHNIADAHDAIIEARVFQAENANKRRRNDPMITKGSLVYLSTANLNLPKSRVRKLCPKFIGPYKVVEARPETSNYTLELPEALRYRRIPTFHVSQLRPHNASDDALFPNRHQPEPYDFGVPENHEWFVDEIIGHRWVTTKQVEYQVRWSLGDTTWEKHANCNQLAALDRYLEVQGVKSWDQLPRLGRK